MPHAGSEPARESTWARDRRARRRAHGFTLIEMIVSLVLISVLALTAAPLLRLPMVAWMDASRRADLTQSIDIVHAKLADDLRRALPNSVRVRQVGARMLLETLEVRAVGRHRAGPSGAAQACPAACTAPGNNDALEPGCSESCFTSLGPLDGDAPVPGSDWLVVNALGPGVAAGDPYFGGNVAVAGGIKSRLLNMTPAPDGNRLQITAHNFPAIAANRQFYLVATPVTWDCDPGAQRLTRRWGYPINAVQPIAFGAATAASPLATRVASCTIGYTAAGSSGRGGVVQLQLRLSATALDSGAPEVVELAASYPVSEGP